MRQGFERGLSVSSVTLGYLQGTLWGKQRSIEYKEDSSELSRNRSSNDSEWHNNAKQLPNGPHPSRSALFPKAGEPICCLVSYLPPLAGDCGSILTMGSLSRNIYSPSLSGSNRLIMSQIPPLESLIARYLVKKRHSPHTHSHIYNPFKVSVIPLYLCPGSIQSHGARLNMTV